jgi:hypothetical protein
MDLAISIVSSVDPVSWTTIWSRPLRDSRHLRIVVEEFLAIRTAEMVLDMIHISFG